MIPLPRGISHGSYLGMNLSSNLNSGTYVVRSTPGISIGPVPSRGLKSFANGNVPGGNSVGLSSS